MEIYVVTYINNLPEEQRKLYVQSILCYLQVQYEEMYSLFLM